MRSFDWVRIEHSIRHIRTTYTCIILQETAFNLHTKTVIFAWHRLARQECSWTYHINNRTQNNVEPNRCLRIRFVVYVCLSPNAQKFNDCNKHGEMITREPSCSFCLSCGLRIVFPKAEQTVKSLVKAHLSKSTNLRKTRKGVQKPRYKDFTLEFTEFLLIAT